MAKTRNVVLAVGCGVVMLFLICGGLIGGGIFFIGRSIAESPFLSDTVDYAKDHPAVIEELGEPIRMSWQNIQFHADFGQNRTRLEVTLKGPDGRGRLEAEGGRESEHEKWEYDYLRFRVRGGETIGLLR